MKKLIITLIVLGVIAGSVGAYYKYRTPAAATGIENMMMNGSRSDSYCEAMTA